jgi:2-amino-4-hydroxy-6-hydroxymethyldihydropteridine diphosphokinase
VSERHEYQVFLGLGSNIRPQEHIPKAIELLRAAAHVERISRIWRTPPVGGAGPDFLNAAVQIRTSLPPGTLKSVVLRSIEARLGRVRTFNKYAPRTIDLDILIVDGVVHEPQIWNLAFQAVPLAELLPDYTNPATGETLAQAARRLAQQVPIEVCPDPQLDCF